ncbi:hypothetical protein V8E36_001607 [Tilletia maclaganii]
MMMLSHAHHQCCGGDGSSMREPLSCFTSTTSTTTTQPLCFPAVCSKAMLSRLSSAVERKLNVGGGSSSSGSSSSKPFTDPSTKLTSLSSADEASLRLAGVSLCAHAQACADCSDSADSDGNADGDDIPEYLDAALLKTWSRQEIDLSPAPLLKIAHPTPFDAHVLISTEGKTDWVREVSEARGSLAETFARFQNEDEKLDNRPFPKEEVEGSAGVTLPEGVWNTSTHAAIQTDATSAALRSSPSRVLFQNSSHFSTSSDNKGNANGQPNHTLLLFPAYQLVTNVPAPVAASRKRPDEGNGGGAGGNERVLRAIWNSVLRSRRPGTDGTKTGTYSAAVQEDRELLQAQGVQRWVLPYRAVVLLCSHKKRDARCSIAASLLASALRHHAEEAGWTVDERGDASSVVGHPSASEAAEEASPPWGLIDESSPNIEAQADRWRKLASLGRGPDDDVRQPQDLDAVDGDEDEDPGTGTLGIFKISHIGGHKYSGNVIIYFPTGAGVWYGRVSPQRDSKLVFEKTIRQGVVIPEFLRAGINLVRPGSSASPPSKTSAQVPTEHADGLAGPTVATPTTLISGTKAELVESGVLPCGSLVRW